MSILSVASRAAAKAGAAKGGKALSSALALGVPTAMGYAMAPKGEKTKGAVKGLADGLLYAYLPYYLVAELGAGVTEGLGSWAMERMHQGPWERQNALRGNFGGNFKDTQQAATMRQRALEEMERSHINARSVLGSEARTYHRSGAYSGRY